MAKDGFGYGNEEINPEWEDRGYMGRTYQSAPLMVGTSAAAIAHMKWLLDPRRPNKANAVRNAGLNIELNKLKPSGTKLNFLGDTKWWQQMIPGQGSQYNPATNTAQVTSKFKYNFDPGIAAHELGHAQQFQKGGPATRVINKMQTPSRLAMNFGMIPQMFIDDEETAKKFAIGSTALSAPTVINELDASRRGRNLLKIAAEKSGTKLSFLKSLAPYKGVPSYLLTAMLPMLYYKYISERGGYKKEGQKKVNKKWGY